MRDVLHQTANDVGAADSKCDSKCQRPTTADDLADFGFVARFFPTCGSLPAALLPGRQHPQPWRYVQQRLWKRLMKQVREE
jgi:hypothetical protein